MHYQIIRIIQTVMANEMSTARTAEIMVDAETLNAMSMGDIFIATGPARMIAERVSVGPVEIVDRRGETWFLIRIDGIIDVLKRTEAEAVEAAAPQIRRFINRLEGNRARAAAEAKRRQEQAAAKAACPGHEYVGREVGRCLTYYACKNCGCGETVDSSD